MAKIQAVWALDIGQAALKALKLVPGETPDTVVAEAFDFLEYPKILSQPDADPEQLVREALETFLERNDMKGCKVAIGVPGQAGLVKFIKLPPVEKKRIPDIVKFEARQQIPFALEEVVWDYQQIGDDDAAASEEDFTMAEVGLFAMKRDQINRAILPFKNAGIEVDIVQMGPIALYNFITFDKLKGGESQEGEKAKDKKESVVLLDIGADNTDLIITDGTRIWQRNVPIGGNHFTRALTKELKLTFAKAEHLKRNATKAPDPRSIFTAMRGVFNDFASEVNRSIGFYSSVNRTAKISKVIGLGNGFKLPGLQKFLQQNLSQEIEKLDSFARMTGDEVKSQPVFQDNLASFAVAYGLGVQGLSKSGLRTNLLPPEIEQVRLIRAKKPWALAAAAMLMIGFAALYLGAYRVLAKVNTPAFKDAVAKANNASKQGADYASAFDAAKNEWKAKDDEGKKLIGNASERSMWPEFLKTISAYLPDPVKEYHLDPSKPSDRPKFEKLAVHIDAIKPVWRQDVAAEWFNDAAVLKPISKDFMAPYDRANAPSGAGWIVQVIGHHYNPYATDPEQVKLPEDSPQRTDFGPYNYLVYKIIPKLNHPRLRLYGVHHVALAWMDRDEKWTTEKGSSTNNMANKTVPILARAIAPAGDAGGMTGGGMPGMMGMGSMAGMGGPDGGKMGRMSGMAGPMGMGGMMPGMGSMAGYGPMGGMGGPSAEDSKASYLTRTDFLIQFVWKPDEQPPKTPEEVKAELEKITKELRDAEQNQSVVNLPKESDLETASKQQSTLLDNAAQQAQQKATTSPAPSGAGATTKAGTAPSGATGAATPPASGAPTPK
jgi:type IV pilus assembly protein PilM